MKALIMFSICAGLALVMFLIVIFALRGGRVGVDGSAARYTWQSCPRKFVAIVFSYFVIGCAFLGGAISIAMRYWRGS